jgi:hypothetical protein
VTLLVEDDVHRFQVAMDQAAVVRVRKAGRHLFCNLSCRGVVKRLGGREPFLERAAREMLEDHVRPSLFAAVVEQSTDVRVGKRRDGLSFPLEPDGVRVGPEQLERHLPVELGVVREPDRRHAARAELLLEAVATPDRLAHNAQ